MRCDHCGADNVVFPDVHGPGRCDPDLSDLETTVAIAEPMTIEEIVKAFENVRGADAIFALFHETEPPVDPIDQQIVRHKLAEILKAHKVSVNPLGGDDMAKPAPAPKPRPVPIKWPHPAPKGK